jgi:hypothetical protein
MLSVVHIFQEHWIIVCWSDFHPTNDVKDKLYNNVRVLVAGQLHSLPTKSWRRNFITLDPYNSIIYSKYNTELSNLNMYFYMVYQDRSLI